MENAAVVEEIATILETSYVFPEIGARYAEFLLGNLSQYVDVPMSELPGRLTRDLQSVNQDSHLRVFVTPQPGGGPGVRVQRTVSPGGGGAEGTSGRRVRTRVGGGPAQAGEAVQAGGAPVGVAATPEQLYSPIDIDGLPEMARALYAQEVENNHFFSKVEILPGNVGYIDYDQFGFPNFSTDAADAAFAFVAEADALILDLRSNRGGIEGMNQYIASHFFGEEPVHLYSRYFGSERTTAEYMTFPSHVARRFPDVPLYVLVNGGTGSAAENLSFALQGLDRATVVGEPTAGGAHSSRPVPLSGGLTLQLPIARAFNPRTDEDWEGEGVQPDIRVDSEGALGTAHSEAIDRLMSTADAERRMRLEDAKLLFTARDAPAIDLRPEDYVGEYGNRRVFVEEGRLKMVRTDVEGMSPLDLVPLSPDYFTLRQASTARIRFERDDAGDVARVHVRLPTGTWEASERR